MSFFIKSLYILVSFILNSKSTTLEKKNSTKKQNQNDYFINEMNTINCLCFILIIGVNLYVHVLYTYLYAPCFKLLSAMFLSVCLLCMFISV